MKPKFNPIVTRVKLNPEQAVLACQCYVNNNSSSRNGTLRTANALMCQINVCVTGYCNQLPSRRGTST